MKEGLPEKNVIPFSDVIGHDLELHDPADNILRGPIIRIDVALNEAGQAVRFAFYTEWIAQMTVWGWKLYRDAADKKVGVPLWQGRGPTEKPIMLVLHGNRDGTVIPVSFVSLLMRKVIIHKPDDHLDRTSLIK